MATQKKTSAPKAATKAKAPVQVKDLKPKKDAKGGVKAGWDLS